METSDISMIMDSHSLYPCDDSVSSMVDLYPYTPLEDPDVIPCEETQCPITEVSGQDPRPRVALCRCKQCGEDKIPWKRRGLLCVECHASIMAVRREVRNSACVIRRKKREEHNRSLGLCACGRELVYERTCKECYLRNKVKNDRLQAKKKALKEIKTSD